MVSTAICRAGVIEGPIYRELRGSAGSLYWSGRRPVGRRLPCSARRSLLSPQARVSDPTPEAAPNKFKKIDGRDPIRTGTTQFWGPVLYRLSYAPIDGGPSGISIPALPVLKTGVLVATRR